MPAFRIAKENLEEGITLFTVQGFLDAHTFEELAKEMSDVFASGVFKLAVDLSGLEYISSAGAGVFIEAIGTAQQNDGDIVLLRPSPSVKEVFDLLGLSQIFTIKESREDAVKSLRVRV
ncbi:MAG: STAS domain-containing protein [Planctomycetes bacterium]|nr:STAS domain-containing protein [Planctomycetota bacterium]